MKISTRIYLDAALQNMKTVAFFAFLPVLIARLGASNFEIALSNSLPPFFCALSLAYLTRQLPVTRRIYLIGGYARQFAFLSMALCALLPNPIPYIMFFWALNAAAVMVTSVQQPAIMRRVVEPDQFPRIFSTNKLIGICIVVSGGFALGHLLDATDRFFPYNYVGSMLVGCLATFTGMSLIASMAPDERIPFRLKRVHPFRECGRTIWWMGLNNVGVAMVGPLFIIYHIKTLHLSNAQIGYFIVLSGLISALILPLVRKWMERAGSMKVYSMSVLGMGLAVFPYGWLTPFWALLLFQAWIGTCLSVYEVSSQSVMMDEAAKHKKEMDYFSDFQLVMNGGNAVGALVAGLLVAVLPLWACFCIIAVIRLAFLWGVRLAPEGNASSPRPLPTGGKQANNALPS